MFFFYNVVFAIDCCGFPHGSLAIVSPLLLAEFPWRFGAVVGCSGIVLAMIGPRMIQGLISPVKALIAGLLQARSDWSSDCIGVVMRA